jgi:hypothetical protein
VAQGTVTITDEAAQMARTGQTAEQVVASLNRDTQGAHHGPLAQNPDLQEILSEQAEISDAAGQAGPAVARTVGDISERQYAETGDERWAEGGLYKTILQAAGSALVAQVGNGNGLNAALGAAASQLAAGKVNDFAKEVAAGMTDDPAKASLIANVIANVVSGGIGYAAGGETGSGAASTMDRYNRQLHKAELARMEKLAEDFARENNILKADGSLDTDEAARRLMQQALLQSGEYWSTEYANDTEANAFLAKNGNGTFFDEATQKYYDFFKASGEDFSNNALFTEHVFDYLNLYQLLSPTSSIYSPSSVIYAVAASDQKNLANMSPETLAKIYDDIYKMRELNLASYESETDPAQKAQISADFYPLLQAELLLTQLLRSNDGTQHIATEAGAEELAQDAVGALVGAKTINSILKILAKTNKVYAEESELGGAPDSNASSGQPLTGEISDKIHPGAQGKHDPSHSNFIPGRSTLNPEIDAQELLNGFHSGQYKPVSTGARGNPVVDFGRPIGTDANTGLPTQFGTIHSGKNGAHIVPANPTIIK